MKRIIRHIKSDDGNTVIEATFVVTICIVIVFVIMMLGFVFYQESLLQSVADRTAVQIARTYSYEKKDPVTGYVDEKGLRSQGLIESMYYFTDKASGKQAKEKKEAETLAKLYIENSRIMATKNQEVSAEISASEMALFQKEVKVTVSESYTIPLVKFLGVTNGEIKYECVGKALCYDVTGAKSIYNMIQIVAKNVAKNTPVGFVEKLCGILNSSAGAIGNLKDFVLEMFGWGGK